MIYTLLLILGSVLFIVVSTTALRLHPFLALLLAALGFGLLSGMPGSAVIEAVTTGFGDTAASIGIVILAGAMIGAFLERSGGALSLAESVLRRTGEKHIPAAMGGIGYVVSLPVFCDTAFIILSSLNKALSRKAGVGVAAGAVALSLGLYATHTMVPPTPGPVAAAGILEADLGLVILWGIVISLFALAAGWLFAVRVAAKVELSAEASVESGVGDGPDGAASRPVRPPGPLSAVVPILLPIILILLNSIADLPSAPFGNGTLYALIAFVGHPAIALLVGVAYAITLAQPFSRRLLSAGGWVGEAVAASAPIIIITAAGGAFGRVLQSADIGDALQPLVQGIDFGILVPFVIAAILKTAQGSSTVAIITSASLMAPFMTALGLDSDIGRALTVVAIGAGSMVVSHANDSYFWVVTQFTGMDVKTGYKLQTVGTLVTGLAALAATAVACVLMV